jgi:diguanylate cyclase (GGDEF)-like protein/PAS domain S-box-containing protein
VNAIGLSYEELLGRTPTEYSSTSHALAYENAIRQVLLEGKACEHEYPWVTVHGRLVISLFNIVPERGADGRVESVLAVGRDITERKRMEEILGLREREFRTLVENAGDTIVRYGRDLRRLYVNPAFAMLFDGDASSLIGVTPDQCPLATTASAYTLNLSEVFESGEPREFELKWNDKNGTEVCHLINLTPEFGTSGAVESILAVGRDITELNAFRQRIHQMAFYDPLTSLPNRALFNDRLRQMMADVSWHGQLAGVMLIDMDRFKEVNDTMGHAVGDELLMEAAVRLSSCVRSYDTVARLGGDEFAILLPQVRSGDDLGRIAGKILDKFGEPFLLDGKEIFVSCSIGIALYPNDSTEANDLVKYADSAMYFAKRSGRNNFRFYSKDLTASANERLALESELRRAIERHELELYYQPKVMLRSGEIVGSEALLRWKNPLFGMVSPLQFIPIAEDTGLIVELGEWVLREACRTAAEWNAEGLPLHKVAINLSARQFQSRDLAALVSNVLEDVCCRPEWIELEITESLLLDEDGKTLDTLAAFQAMGISIAIDDFGTGYSALSYLARFPVNTLKIDKSFIHSVTTDKYRAELVKAILSIARCLKQQVVAEGVETLEQAAFLEANGCHVAQGYLYSKPVPKAEAASLPRRFGD